MPRRTSRFSSYLGATLEPQLTKLSGYGIEQGAQTPLSDFANVKNKLGTLFFSNYLPWKNRHKVQTIFVGGSPLPPPLTPQGGRLLPTSPVTMTSLIPSYLYEEYNDDDSLQAFVASYNAMGQEYLDTLNALNLPIYTSTSISGTFLQWVGEGIYGLARPTLTSGLVSSVGQYNTFQFDTLQYDGYKFLYPVILPSANDDIYRRAITWHFFKADGKYFDVRWLKRRIMRFCYGANGVDPGVDQTYPISVTFGPNFEATIRFVNSTARLANGMQYNTQQFDTTQFDYFLIVVTQLPPVPYQVTFQQAARSGALELPFQFSWDVIIK